MAPANRRPLQRLEIEPVHTLPARRGATVISAALDPMEKVPDKPPCRCARQQFVSPVKSRKGIAESHDHGTPSRRRSDYGSHLGPTRDSHCTGASSPIETARPPAAREWSTAPVIRATSSARPAEERGCPRLRIAEAKSSSSSIRGSEARTRGANDVAADDRRLPDGAGG